MSGQALNIYVSSVTNRDFVARVKASSVANRILGQHRVAGDYAVAALRLLFKESISLGGELLYTPQSNGVSGSGSARELHTMRAAVERYERERGTWSTAFSESQQLLAKAQAEAQQLLVQRNELVAAARQSQRHLAFAVAESEQRLAFAVAETQASAEATAQQRLARADADSQQQLARALADSQEQLARAKSDSQQQLARANADSQQQLARAEADYQQRLACAQSDANQQLSRAVATTELLLQQQFLFAECARDGQQLLARAEAEAAEGLEIAQVLANQSASLSCRCTLLHKNNERLLLEVESLHQQRENHYREKQVVEKRDARAASNEEISRGKSLALASQSNKAFINLLQASPSPPPEQKHLCALIRDQLACYSNDSHYCHWSPEVLSWCADVLRINRTAYDTMASGGVLLLPHPSGQAMQAHLGKVKGVSGHSDELYQRLLSASDQLKSRKVCVIFDEINIAGELQFKVVKGEYHFFGLVDDYTRSALYSSPKESSVEENMKGKIASHALVFQVTCLGCTKFRHVCGVHAVSNLNATILDTLFWQTVAHLEHISKLTTVAVVCDGAGCNRLFMKMNTSHMRKGSPNTFVKAWALNKGHESTNTGALTVAYAVMLQVSDDLRAKIFFISDPSHLVKKVCNHWEKSKEHGPRNLSVPDYLVQMVLELFEAGNVPQHIAGLTIGEEFYARLFGRLYDLMASSHAPPYYHGDHREPRIQELETILRIVREWYSFNLSHFAHETAKQRASHFFSHQLYFDLQVQNLDQAPQTVQFCHATKQLFCDAPSPSQMMVEGFKGLLVYLEEMEGIIAILARKLNQDSLESIFGHLRQVCGGGRDPNLFKVVTGIPAVEEKRMSLRRSAHLQRSTNSGQSGSAENVGSGWLDGHRISITEHMFTLRCVHAGRLIVQTVPVRWKTLREFQTQDERRQRMLGMPKHMPWLTTSQHINKTGFSRMKVGLASAVVSIRTARMMNLARTKKLAGVHM